MSTRFSTVGPASPYIVVLDVAADAVRALLFDCEGRRVEGYGAQLPWRADAASDCLDEMHRLVRAGGFRVGAVMGRAESEVAAEDRSNWPAFRGAAWVAALPEGTGMVLGSGCVDDATFALVVAEKSMLATVVTGRLAELPEGLEYTQIDEKRWLISGALPEAGRAYAELRQALKAKRSVEEYLESAAAEDPHFAPVLAAGRRFRELYDMMTLVAGRPAEVVGTGGTLLKSPAFSQRLANALGAPLTLCTEPEPAGRGAALWALERIGAIENLGSLAASTATVFEPISSKMTLEKTT